MADPPTFESIVSQLQVLLQREYQRGADDAMRRVVQAAQSTLSATPAFARRIHPPPPTAADQLTSGDETRFTRASRGAPDALIRRVLALRYPAGASSVEIQKMAESDSERKVSLSGIRFALEKGRERGFYRHLNGDWFLSEAPS
jgi:hypothetical protein